MPKTILQKQVEKMIETENAKLPEIVRMFLDLQMKVTKRCMLEGCVYGYPVRDKKPADECLYCGTPRPESYSFWSQQEIQRIKKDIYPIPQMDKDGILKTK